MDKSMLGDLDGLPEEDKMRMAAMVDQLQIRDRSTPYSSSLIIYSLDDLGALRANSGILVDGEGLKEAIFVGPSAVGFFQDSKDLLRMYNALVERCFTDCVDTFRRKTLDKQEESCVRRCAEKFLKHSMRVGMRFAELNQGVATPD